MYSPFFDKQGRPLVITKVLYNHLEQLKQCEEGHFLEFKSKLDTEGKQHIPYLAGAGSNWRE